MDIGEQRRVIVVEPLHEPEPAPREPAETPGAPDLEPAETIGDEVVQR